MPQYGLFQAIFMSFYSRKLYRDVAVNWGAKSLVYLLMLLCLSWIFFTVQIQRSLITGYSALSEAMVTQIPVMTLNNGKLSTPLAKPYLITDPQSGEELVVIDTTGQYTSLDQTKAFILITDSKILIRPKPNQQRINELPAKLNFTFHPEKVNDLINKFIYFLWIPIFILSISISFIYRMLQSLIYAVLGKLMGYLMGVQLSYWQIVQVMMVAITPVIVTCTVLHSLYIVIPHHNLFYFLLAMGYLVYGILANKPDTGSA